MKYFFSLLLLFILVYTNCQNKIDIDKYQQWQRLVNNFESVSELNLDSKFIRHKELSDIKQYKRWEYCMDLLSGDNGEYDVTKIEREYLNYEQTKYFNDDELGDWQQIGPVGLVSRIGTGRVNVIGFDPERSNVLWLGSASGGLWKSINGGEDWKSVGNDFRMMGVSDIAISSDSTHAIYVATGDRDAGIIGCYGLFRSTDEGVTWQKTNLPKSKSIYRVLINENNSKELYVSTDTAVYKTSDSGDNWHIIFSGQKIREIEIRPGDFNTLYVTDVYGIDKFFVSRDGGINFTKINIEGLKKSVARLGIGTTKANPDLVYLLAGVNKGGTNANDFQALYKSVDAGNSFVKVDVSYALNLGSQMWYDWVIVVSPTDENEIFVGGVDFYSSKDSGKTWKISISKNLNSLHVDHHFAGFHPITAELYVGNDGGVYKSIDHGNDWISLNKSLSITQYYKISSSANEHLFLIGGAQDNGTQVLKNKKWKRVINKDGMDCVIDQSNSDIIYASSQNGYFKKSINRGDVFKHMLSSSITNEDGAWVTPLVIDPTNSNFLFAGYQSLWRSKNQGENWHRISHKLPLDQKIHGISISESNNFIIYIFSKKSLYKSIDRGLNFVELSIPENAIIKDVAISPQDHQKIWLVIGNHVYLSTNGGKEWQLLDTGLPNIPLTSIAVQNNDIESVYIGSHIGVFYRDTILKKWVSFNKGLPRTIISDIEIKEQMGEITIGTFGRGMWSSLLEDYPKGALECVSNLHPKYGAIDFNDTIKFAWEPNLFTSGYKIEIGSSSGQNDILDTIVNTSKNCFDWINDRNHEAIYVRINPFNKYEISSNCSESKIVLTCRNDDIDNFLKFYQALDGKESGVLDSSYCDLSKLNGVYVRFNDSDEIVYLSVSGYKKRGYFSESITKLKSLKKFLFTSFPLDSSAINTISKLENLEELKLIYCRISGDFPKALTKLKKLEVLDLSKNMLTGKVQFADFPKLKKLYLKNNRFDEIGNDIGLIENCTILDISNNILKCSIPDSIGKLVNLRSLYLNTNKLTGSIPKSISNLIDCKYLNLGNNNLSGQIPDEIGNLENLRELNLSKNEFSGQIPESICKLSDCKYLNLSSNKLTGFIPEKIGDLSRLNYLSLSYNNLIGHLPNSIGKLNACQNFLVMDNKLSGELPVTIGGMDKLKFLNLKNNQFYGAIPDSIANLEELTSFYLSNNKYADTFPISLFKIKNLKYLDISGNGIYGNLPPLEIETRLINLNLSNNRFSGLIPKEYGGVQTLYLNNNDLEGCIPSTFVSFCFNYYFPHLNNNPKLQNADDFSSFCDNGIGNCDSIPKCSSGLEFGEEPLYLPFDLPIKWKKVDNAIGYIVSVGSSIDSMDIVDSIDVGSNNWIDLGDLELGKRLFVRVLAYNQFGESFNCEVFHFIASDFHINAVGINSDIDNLIRIYPNPAKNYVKIKRNCLDLGIGHIQILDITGSTIKDFSFFKTEKEIDISFLKNGVYTMIISFSEQRTHKKLVIFKN